MKIQCWIRWQAYLWLVIHCYLCEVLYIVNFILYHWPVQPKHSFRAQKVLSIRLFDDEDEKRWMKSVKDLSLELLCISQFTLYHTRKGNKPDFRQAMSTEDSKKLYQAFLERVKTLHKPELSFWLPNMSIWTFNFCLNGLPPDFIGPSVQYKKPSGKKT